MHNVFVSYHHDNDQFYKNQLVSLGSHFSAFVDRSVDTGDISEDLPDEAIRRHIRDNYLRQTTVTVVLVGVETKHRKHVDWEIHSSMYDGSVNHRSGILVIALPSTGCTTFTAAHEGEKSVIYPDVHAWTTVTQRSEYESRYPHMPDRIIDNLLKDDVRISVTPWERIANRPDRLEFLIDAAFEHRKSCRYDLSRPMRRRNG